MFLSTCRDMWDIYFMTDSTEISSTFTGFVTMLFLKYENGWRQRTTLAGYDWICLVCWPECSKEERDFVGETWVSYLVVVLYVYISNSIKNLFSLLTLSSFRITDIVIAESVFAWKNGKERDLDTTPSAGTNLSNREKISTVVITISTLEKWSS